MRPSDMAETLPTSEGSILQLLDKLCTYHLEITTNHKKALVTRQKFNTSQHNKLKKTLYYNLFVGLHSPYVLPSKYDYDIDHAVTSFANDVYSKLAEYIFNIRMQFGQVRGADRLEKCGDSLKHNNDEVIDKTLDLLLKLSNYFSNPTESMFQKSHQDDSSRYFQFDQKALDLGDALQSSTNWNKEFEVSNTSIFSLPPGSFSKGDTSSWINRHLKESRHDLRSRLTLFGGLTNSTTTSLEVTLCLPELPRDPNQMTFGYVESEHSEISFDEGFYELSSFSSSNETNSVGQTKVQTISMWDELSIWDEAVALGKLNVSTWERPNSIDIGLDNLYFCQLGKQGFDCMYNVRLLEVMRITGQPLQVVHISEEQMYRDTLYALIGVPSISYIFYPKSCMMKPALNICCAGVSMETLYDFMCKFAQVGTHYRQLCRFCQHHSDKPKSGTSGGLILNAFIGALKEILHSYRSAYFIILDINGLTMMELWRLFEMFAKQLKFLAEVCLCSEAFSKSKGEKIPKPKFPVGANLLSYIYSLAVKNSSTGQYPLLLFIFKCISVPYIRFLTDWLLEGVSNDPYNEFFVHTEPQYLRSRDKHFWTQGFQMIQRKGSIPLFLDDLAEDIFACGKAISLLKLIDVKHYLFQGSVRPPPIDVTYSWSKFDSIEERCKEYVRLIHECELKEKEKKEREKLEAQNAVQDKLRRAKLAVEKEVKRIDELEEKVKVAIRFKKTEEFNELREQFEKAVSEKKNKRIKQLEEDNAWIEEMRKDDSKKDAIKQKAREELILFYEKLSQKAEQREEHARWIIQRHELYEKRKDFLKKENEKILKEYTGSFDQGHRLDPVNNVVSESSSILSCTVSIRGNDEKPSSSDLNRKPRGKQTDLNLDDQMVMPVIDRKYDRVNDQSLSSAKSLLYPISDQSSANTTLKSGVTERIDCEGNSAKLAMYPSSSEYSLPACKTSVNVDGNETKQLIYPHIPEKDGLRIGGREKPDIPSRPDKADTSIEEVSKLLLYPDDKEDTFNPSKSIRNDGSDTKSLLYPQPSRNLSDANVVKDNSTTLKNVEVCETKSLLYPGEIIRVKDDDLKSTSIRGGASSGDETKHLLYPSEDKAFESITEIQKCRKYLKGEFTTEGSETKGLLYPDITQEKTKESNSSCVADSLLKVDEGKEMKDMLYPDLAYQHSQIHVIKDFERPSIMDSVIYPDPGNPDQGMRKHQVREFERPSAMQSVIYPSTDAPDEGSVKHQVREFERPSTMQSVIYQSSDYIAEKHEVKEYERASTVQNILYPTGNLQIISKESSRGFEPPTRIKELIYHGSKEKGKIPIEIDENGLTFEEVWMGYIPEPYTDRYDILDMDPQAYSFGDVIDSSGDVYNMDEDADVIKRLPLETVIKRSLTIPIKAQVSLVNSAVVKYFLDDLKIEVHFDAFRKFLLLEDGEFGHSLCHSLFEKIALGMKPQKFFQSMLFTNIIPEALNMSLYASMINVSRQLKFSLKWMPDVFYPSDVAALDFLELRYRVPWPCNIVITENSITKYNKVFSFLLRLKKASWSLQNVWLNLKRAGFDRKAAVSPQLRQLHLFRHEMQHFVNNLERYIVNQIIHVSWQEFQEELRQVQSLDNLHKCHVHYLDKIIFRSLLSKNATPVYNLINEMFGIIAKFESRLLSQSWEAEKESGFVQHPLFGMLKEGHRAFKCGAGFLFSVIQNLVKRGYQDHLDDLLLQVNFNTYYNTTAKT